jgi:hypothetical protein
MTAEEYRTRRQEPGGPLALDRPILITDALPVSKCEELCEKWIQAVGSLTITVQRRRKYQERTTQLYECTVEQSLDLMMESTPKDSFLAFVEGLLDCKQLPAKNDMDDMAYQQQRQQQLALDSVQRRLVQARESLFCRCDDENWFDHFPDPVKPSDCVIMAGEGATSTLHRDPFEWTGTSLCLEGRKIWRFLAPDKNTLDGWDERLRCYRLESIAWDSNGNDHDDIDKDDNNAKATLSAGWQSDLSLYHDSESNNLYSARELADLDEPNAETYLETIANSLDILQPHPEIIAPLPTMGVDCCSVVQHPGELLLIPPYWYHQTYAPEPSLAVASQRCGSLLDARRVLRHILSLQSTDGEQQLPQILQELVDGSVHPSDVDVQETVLLLFNYLQQSKHQ